MPSPYDLISVLELLDRIYDEDPDGVLSTAEAAKALTREQGMAAATARRLLNMAVEKGQLLRLTPTPQRRISIPGVKLAVVSLYLSNHSQARREGGVPMYALLLPEQVYSSHRVKDLTVVITPSRCERLAERINQAVDERARQRRQEEAKRSAELLAESEARRAEGLASIREHDEELAELAERVHRLFARGGGNFRARGQAGDDFQPYALAEIGNLKAPWVKDFLRGGLEAVEVGRAAHKAAKEQSGE